MKNNLYTGVLPAIYKKVWTSVILLAFFSYPFHLGANTPPVNDDPAGAIAITGPDWYVEGSNEDATKSAPTWFDDNLDVWYTYTPSATQKVTVTTCGQANFDTQIEVFDATLVNRVARNKDGAGCANYTSKTTLLMIGGQTYYINVGGQKGETGDFKLSLLIEELTVLEGGMTCNEPVALLCDQTIIGHTLDAMDPVYSGAPGTSGDVPQAPGKWYSIQVDEDQVVRLSTCNEQTNYDTDIEVYTGECGNLTLVASSDHGPGYCFNGSLFSADLIFVAEAGVEYKVFVNGFVNEYSGPKQGLYELSVYCSSPDCEIYGLDAEKSAVYGLYTTVCSDGIPQYCEELIERPAYLPPGSITSLFVVEASAGAIYLTDPENWSLKINGIETPFIYKVIDWEVLAIQATYYAGPGIDAEFSFGENCSIAIQNIIDAPESCSTFLGDYVWEDLDRDGMQDMGEPGVAGVPVYLYSSDGTLVASTTTDENGYYAFYPPPGDHYVVFGNVPGYFFTEKDQTTDDLDSDVMYDPNSGIGRTEVFNVTYPYYNEDVDAGLISCPPVHTLACNDHIAVTANDDCEALITADMILEGNYICYKDLIVDVIAPGDISLGNVVTSEYYGMKLIAEVTDPATGYGCWGYVTVEDKTEPYFECWPEEIDHVYKTYDTQTAKGYLSERQRGQINFSDYSCFQDEYGTPGDCPEPYDVLEFYVSKTDVYTFEAWDPERRRRRDRVENDNELHIALFQGSFTPDEPCANIVAQSNISHIYGVVEEDEDPDGRIRIAVPLQAGKKYSLLVAQDDCSRDRGDQWIIYAFSDGDGEILDGPKSENGIEDLDDNFGETRSLKVKKELYCSDVDYILNSDEYTKNPRAYDNCDPEPQTWFKDELVEEGDCGDIYIKRIWYIRDASGNDGESCHQKIRFKRPTLRDVQKPATTVPIECDEISAEWLDENGHPLPAISGYPFVITAFGIKDLDESLCNVGADYRDISVIDVCENTVKIVRQWIILDWCDVGGQWELNNGTKVNWRQIIKVGDFSAPTVEQPSDATVNAGAFACEGILRIADLEVEDNCSAAIEITATVYEIVKSPKLDRYGREIPGEYVYSFEVIAEGRKEGDLVSGIALGNKYKIHYEITDGCGNATEASYEVTAEDNIEPVAVCKDDLHISIGGDGIGRVDVEDVDEGSWDNCELEGVYISRKLTSDAARDAYLTEVYGIVFADLKNAGQIDKDNSSPAMVYVMKSNEQEVLRFKDGMWFTWWQLETWFTCLDMGETVTIELLAVDIFHNTNVCWLDVLIEDKVAPYCVAPADVTIDCTDLPWGFDPDDADQLSELFGDATAQDNCEATAVQVGATNDLECLAGTITRTFQATDNKGLVSNNKCEQKIYVRAVHNYEIKFPKDVSADCNEPLADTIVTTEIACDLLSVNVYDERFEASDDACYKIKRTYKVINWCEYDGESDPFVVSRDEDCDGVTGEHDVYVLRRPALAYIDVDNDETKVPTTSPCGNGAKGHLTNGNVDDRFGEDGVGVGYWQYSQFIKVYDSTPPTIEGEGDVFCSLSNEDCSGTVSIDLTIDDFCTLEEITVKVFLLPDPALGLGKLNLQDTEIAALFGFELTGTRPNFTISGRFPLGDHIFEVHAIDGCRNSELLEVPFTVADCKAPAPICINGLAVELMPTEDGGGAMAIWATDFEVSGIYDDCSGPVKLSINRVGETPDPAQTSLLLTCDDPDTLAVEIYAWDSADNPTAIQPDGTIGGPNYDFCVTYVLVQDNMFDLCDDPAAIDIAGLIVNEENEAVENVVVNLTGDMENVTATAADGQYLFSGLIRNSDYTITPIKEDDYINGVSTFDLVLITKHILRTRKLQGAYKLIAADINNSGTITAIDLIHLRKLILSIYREFPNNSSWRFVPASYQFPNEENPWSTPFPEILNYNDLQASIANGDFVAVKIGDVNGNAVPNSRIAEERDLAGAFYLHVADQEVKAGQEYRVTFTSDQLNVQGYQFTLNHTGLELIDIEYGVAKAEHFGILEDGVITTSWNQEKSQVGNGESELFTLVVKAKIDGQMSELLQVNSRYTRAEAYDQSDALLDVALRFDDAQSWDAFRLEQNVPNPFAGQTSIGFYLPDDMETTIKIQDMSGRILKIIRNQYAKGYNQVRINGNDLPSTGVFYYTLETAEYTATKKMIVIGE